MTFIPRLLAQDIQDSLQNNKVLLILGARQVGKTTLVNHILQGDSGAILNMDVKVDHDRLKRAAALEPSAGLKTLTDGRILIIDEAQRIKDIGRITKGWYDRAVTTKIILLGSASANLLTVAAGELVGRNQKLWLTPLLFREVLSQQQWYSPQDTPAQTHEFFPSQLNAILMERLVYGSYPDAYLTSDPKDYLTTLTSDYLFKDIFGSAAVRATEDIRNLLLELARATGQTISYLQLATRLKISRPTAQKYLRLLEESFIIFSVPAYSTQPTQETARSYKYYFWDTGVKNALLHEWNVSSERSDIRQLWDNWIMAEVKKLSVTLNRSEEIFFWQSRNGSKVDLVIKQGTDLHPFDFRFYPDEANPSRAFRNRYNLTPKTIHPANMLEVLR